MLQKLADRIDVYGEVEVETGHVSTQRDDGDDSTESDIALATVELGLTARLHKQARADIVLLWEEDDTEPIDLDEGYLTLGGEEDIPVFLQAGRFYVPFTVDDSFFITDPPTLELAETNETSLLLGYTWSWLTFSVGAFNVDIEEGGDDRINSAYASLGVDLPEGEALPFGVLAGVSWLSNLADSDVLSDDHVESETIDNIVGAWAAHAILSYENYTLFAEYVAALKDFEAGVFNFNPDRKSRPGAWAVEAAATFEPFTIAGTDDFFGGADDVDDFPEHRLGLVATYEFLKYAAFSLEYMYDSFENGDIRRALSSQLAVKF